MFDEIQGSSRWIKIIPLNKGWSKDKKYHIFDADGSEYLLRISDISQFDKKEKQFKLLQTIATLDVNCSKPLAFGKLNETQVYILLSYLPGEDAETAIPKMSMSEQYEIGIEAGKILLKLHSIDISEYQEDIWWKHYQQKMIKKIENINNCSIVLKNKELVIEYVLKNMYKVASRRVKFQHADYHVGNMVVNQGKIGIIDFDKNGIADPFDEFKPFCWNVYASPYFETGLIDGYFNNEVPLEFFEILALYSAESLLSQLPWACTYGGEEIQIALKVADSVLQWYNNYQLVIPTWYKKPVR